MDQRGQGKGENEGLIYRLHAAVNGKALLEGLLCRILARVYMGAKYGP